MEKLTKEYLLLFNAISDAETTLRQLRERLLLAQCQAEELYIEKDETQEERHVS